MFIKSTVFFHSVSSLFLIASHWFCSFSSPPAKKIPCFQGLSLFLYCILVLKAFEHSFQEGWKREALQKKRHGRRNRKNERRKEKAENSVDCPQKYDLWLEELHVEGVLIPSLHSKCNVISFFLGRVLYLKYSCEAFIRHNAFGFRLKYQSDFVHDDPKLAGGEIFPVWVT